EVLRIAEEKPRGAFVEKAANVSALGISFAVIVAGMAGPHKRNAVVSWLENLDGLSEVVRNGRRFAQARIFMELAQTAGSVVLVEEDIAGVKLVIGRRAEVLPGLH